MSEHPVAAQSEYEIIDFSNVTDMVYDNSDSYGMHLINEEIVCTQAIKCADLTLTTEEPPIWDHSGCFNEPDSVKSEDQQSMPKFDGK